MPRDGVVMLIQTLSCYVLRILQDSFCNRHSSACDFYLFNDWFQVFCQSAGYCSPRGTYDIYCLSVYIYILVCWIWWNSFFPYLETLLSKRMRLMIDCKGSQSISNIRHPGFYGWCITVCHASEWFLTVSGVKACVPHPGTWACCVVWVIVLITVPPWVTAYLMSRVANENPSVILPWQGNTHDFSVKIFQCFISKKQNWYSIASSQRNCESRR